VSRVPKREALGDVMTAARSTIISPTMTHGTTASGACCLRRGSVSKQK
jgi:hypothetical protein